jgi:hypothetical protein
MPVNKGAEVGFRRGLADGVRHVNREEIRRIEEGVHRFEPDVVGVHVPRFVPAEFFHRLLRCGAHAGWPRPDDVVLAIGLVPNRRDLDALPRRQHDRLQLRFGLVRKPVAHAKGKLAETAFAIHARAE